MDEYKLLYKYYSDLKDQLNESSELLNLNETRKMEMKIEKTFKQLVNLKREIMNQKYLKTLFKSQNNLLFL